MGARLERFEGERERPIGERAAARLGLYLHAGKFGAVMLLLLAINLLTSPAYLWFVWPLLGWGIGLASHAAGVLGAEWRERQLAAMLSRERRERWASRPADDGERVWPDLG